MMRAEGSIENEILPEYIFDAADECEAPGSLAITSNDVTNVLNAYQHYMIVQHKQPAGDKTLRVHHAKQLKQRFPKLPTYGTTPGPLRKWYKILTERKRNASRKRGLEVRARLPCCRWHTCVTPCVMPCVTQCRQFHGITFTPAEIENIPVELITAGFKPRVAERAKDLDMERKPLCLKPPSFQLKEPLPPSLSEPPLEVQDDSNESQVEANGDVASISQRERDAKDKAAKTAAALQALDSEEIADALIELSEEGSVDDPASRSSVVVVACLCSFLTDPSLCTGENVPNGPVVSDDDGALRGKPLTAKERRKETVQQRKEDAKDGSKKKKVYVVPQRKGEKRIAPPSVFDDLPKNAFEDPPKKAAKVCPPPSSPSPLPPP